MRLISFVCLFAVLGTSLSAETYRCVRKSLSSSGFSNSKVAESWFPKVVEFHVQGDEVNSNYYGKGIVIRKTKRIRFEFELEGDGSNDATVIYTYIPKSRRYTSKLGAVGGFQQIVGGVGACAVS